jgi:precorrin-2 dehydrogenase / sirohydrochlorin ferrochelatase
MPGYYPMFVNLEGKRCLVVGGGEVATHKVQSLLESGAVVIVVSPLLTEPLVDLVQRGIVQHMPRPFQADDVLDCTLVIGATDQPEVNATVCEAARRHGILVNIVDTPAACDFIAPAVVRRGPLQIAISTGGNSPTLAKRIREQIEACYGMEYADFLRALGAQREQVQRLITDPALRKAYYEHVVDLFLAGSEALAQQRAQPAVTPAVTSESKRLDNPPVSRRSGSSTAESLTVDNGRGLWPRRYRARARRPRPPR